MSLKADTPAPPDPYQVAQAQTASNAETARLQAQLNRVNQYTPFGSGVYSQTPAAGGGGTTPPTPGRGRGKHGGGGTATPATPGSDQWNYTVTLSPNQQALLEKGEQLGIGARDLAAGQLGRIRDAISSPWSYDGMPAAPQADEAARSRYVAGIMSRMQPQFERDREALESRLAAQGIQMGAEAYDTGMDELRRAQTDARIQADLAGLQEMRGMFDMGATSRDRAIQEAAYARQQPINEAAALMGTGQGLSLPQFSQLPQTGVAPTDMAGIIQNGYQNQMAYANAQNAPMQAALGGLFGLGGAALGGWAQNW